MAGTSSPAGSNSSTKPKYVKIGYQYIVNNFLTIVLVPIMISIGFQLHRICLEGLVNIWNSLQFKILCTSFLFIFIATIYFMSKPRTIYLVDYACYKPPVTCRVPFSTFMEHSRLILTDHPKSVEFQMRIL
ncbi:hypothetical protein QQ045_020531 [Rhodiola kirilowii]